MTFSETMKELNGYETITTFWNDFSIADKFGEEAIIDTFKRSKYWIEDYKYWTELVLVLNHKIWYWYEQNEKTAGVYNVLWETAIKMFFGKYEENAEAVEYYYRVLD